jgi:diacylglycerol kinase (ATP)
MKTCLIVNPNAGSAEELEQLHGTLERLAPMSFWETAASGDARRLAERAAREGYEYVIACGGDGTLNEIVNGLVPAKYEGLLGILPVGTGNDLTRSLYPERTREEIADMLVAAAWLTVDVGQLEWDGGSRLFLNSSAMGFAAMLSQQMTSDLKKWIGWAAYPVTAVKNARELEAYHATFQMKDGESFTAEVFNITVSNGEFIGGGIQIAPRASLNDGLLDVFVFPAMRVGQALNLVPLLWGGRHMDREEFLFRTAERLRISAKTTIPLNADGEYIGEVRDVEYSLLPNALRLVTDGSSRVLRKL